MRKLKSKTEVPEQRDITAWEMTVLLALSFLLFIISQNFFFFWDNITQLSVPANYYFDSKFATLYVPDEITTGHQPFVGMYFAAGWHLLGRTLFASHLLMLPVVFGVLFQLYRLSGFFLKEKKQQWIALTILVMESTLLSQLSLLTFEVFHVFFFLATINALLRDRNWWGALFFSGLMLVSLRATMSGIGLVLSVLLYQIFILKKFTWQQYIPFLPGVLLFIIFLTSFYYLKGWIIHNTVSQRWEGSAKYADVEEMLRNAAIFAWRLLDFGKVIFLLLAIFICLKIYKLKLVNRSFLILIVIAAGQFIIFFGTTIPYQNTISHRYLLPVTMPLMLAIVYWFLTFKKNKKFFIIYIFIYLGSGYFWLYPAKMAKGWDAMPLHWTYYKGWNEMADYIKQKKIQPENISTFFPNTASFRNIALKNDDKQFLTFPANTGFVLYSNAFNESDETIDALFNTRLYTPIHQVKNGAVYFILFKKVQQ